MLCVVYLHIYEAFCSGLFSSVLFSGLVMRLIDTSLCCMTECAICVSYCVIVCGCGLVLIIAC